MPRNTRERRLVEALPSPVAEFAVPVSGPANVLTTQTGVPPDESGSGGPKRCAQGWPLGQSALVAHSVRLLKQFFACVGPIPSHNVSVSQSQVGTQSWFV